MGNLNLNLLTLPLWWYTTGFSIVWKWNKRHIIYGLHQTGLLEFIRHLREPLYGDYTKSGRFLGVLFRLVLLLFKLVLLGIRVVLLLLIDVFYLLILPFALSLVIFQLTSVI